MENAVGIIGGIGPMSTVYFYELVLSMTDASCDQDHVNMIILNHASIPDRTAFICGKSDASPLPCFVQDAKGLEEQGARFIVIPCNTAHYFYDEVAHSVSVPVVNIVTETVARAAKLFPGLGRLGVLATDGTLHCGTYELACKAQGIECVTPDEDCQKQVMSLIYDTVKAGKAVDRKLVDAIIDHMLGKGCECIVLGCTELSLAKKYCGITDRRVLDSLDVLARCTVERAGKKLRAEYRDTED